MGWRFRKAFGFGPLRFTLTHRGISRSVGVPGFRVTHRVDGRIQTTRSVPGTGLSHVQVHGQKPVLRIAHRQLAQTVAVLTALLHGFVTLFMVFVSLAMTKRRKRYRRL
jgi:hypothetical protein